MHTHNYIYIFAHVCVENISSIRNSNWTSGKLKKVLSLHFIFLPDFINFIFAQFVAGAKNRIFLLSLLWCFPWKANKLSYIQFWNPICVETQPHTHTRSISKKMDLICLFPMKSLGFSYMFLKIARKMQFWGYFFGEKRISRLLKRFYKNSLVYVFWYWPKVSSKKFSSFSHEMPGFPYMFLNKV